MADGGTGSVIVLTGPCGAGKSTVARVLAGRLTPSVRLHGDDFFGFIERGAIAPYLPQAQHQNETVIDVQATAAAGYAAGGYHVVFDGVVGPWFLAPFHRAAAEAGVPLDYVVLRPERDVVMARATARGTGALTDPEAIGQMFDEFADLGDLEPHALDSGALTPEQTADTIASALASGAYRLR
ncbi:AAA family ATPase [Actinomadura yumaensis]|uniref:AAA family ATPase n=1 Tax=Actinomadura yumaensis TaxID=111807 RepID=A0ABW2CGD6_9ACTN